MKISFIVATLGERDISPLLSSLENQIFKDFEVIIIDQSKDQKMHDFISLYKNTININYIHSSILGISLNRNLGIQQARGEILAFPDDDCEYPVNMINKITLFFNKNPKIDILSIAVKNKINLENLDFTPLVDDIKISFKNLFKAISSVGLFINNSRYDKEYFDEKMGLGSKFGSCEEIDLIARLLHNGRKGFYTSKFYIFHPEEIIANNTSKYLQKAMGYGAYFKKNYKRSPYIYSDLFLRLLFKPIVSMFYYLLLINLKDFKRHWLGLIYHFRGFIQYK
jgi:glycosyltransferase involved in cell wall biosynthesis